jgi:hypothetical protein
VIEQMFTELLSGIRYHEHVMVGSGLGEHRHLRLDLLDGRT